MQVMKVRREYQAGISPICVIAVDQGVCAFNDDHPAFSGAHLLRERLNALMDK